MPITSYATDDGVQFVGTFLTEDTLVSYDPPGGVLARVRRPDKTTQTYIPGVDVEFVHTSTGVYTLTILVSQPGQWGCHMEGVGGPPNPAIGAAAADDRITVRPPAA